MASDKHTNIERAKLDYLRSVIEDAARRKLGACEAARDCVMIFLEQTIEMPEAQQWPYAAEAEAEIAAAANRCAKAEAERLRRLRMREQFILELGGSRRLSVEFEPASPAIGPEQRAVLSTVTTLAACAAEQLHPRYKELFVSIFVEGKTHVEAAARFNRSRQSVDNSVKRLLAAIRRVLARQGLTDEEVMELLNDLDRCRSTRIATSRLVT